MTTAVNNQTNQDVYTALGLNAPNSNATKKKNTLDQADFLRLMTEQLQHQDPLKPMDNTQMVAQMAQMSTVQGITDLNKTVKGFQESMASDQVLRGAALVGHQVLVPSEKLVLEKEGNVEGTVAAPSAGIITVDITDATGAKVTSLAWKPRPPARLRSSGTARMPMASAWSRASIPSLPTTSIPPARAPSCPPTCRRRWKA